MRGDDSALWRRLLYSAAEWSLITKWEPDLETYNEHEFGKDGGRRGRGNYIVLCEHDVHVTLKTMA